VDLIHFMMIFILVVGIYTVQSYYLFGNAIEEFSTLPAAFNTCFNMLMGDNSVNDAVLDLRPVAGSIFIYTFILIVFFVLLNILLAILVEAYMDVAKDAMTQLSVTEQVFSMMKSSLKGTQCYRSRDKKSSAMTHMDDSEILAYMGRGEEEDEEELDEAGRVVGSHLKLQYVLKVPVDDEDEEWLDAREDTIIKALMIHPQTKELEPEKLRAIAASIIYRYGVHEDKAQMPTVNAAMTEALQARHDQLEEKGLLSPATVTATRKTNLKSAGAVDISAINDQSAPNDEGNDVTIHTEQPTQSSNELTAAFYHAPSFTAPAGINEPAPTTPPPVPEFEMPAVASSASDLASDMPASTPSTGFTSFMPPFLRNTMDGTGCGRPVGETPAQTQI